jgi:hypothetical protein
MVLRLFRLRYQNCYVDYYCYAEVISLNSNSLSKKKKYELIKYTIELVFASSTGEIKKKGHPWWSS